MKQIAKSNLITERLAALSDLVRLRLLRLLEREELSVGELSRIVQLPQSTVSRQLKVLAGGEWLAVRNEGTSTLYRLVLDDLTTDARALWLAVREQMGESTELAEDTRRLGFVLAERRTDTQAFFGRLAGEWDGVRNELFGERFTLAALLPLLPREWTVADLGCGTGNAAEYLAPVVKKVIAVDQSPAMVAAAQKRLRGSSNVSFVQASLDSLPIETASADAAVCVLVLHHLENPLAALKEARRIVRPGGRTLVVDMLEHDRAIYRQTMGHKWLGFSEYRIIALLTEAGFDQPRLNVIPVETATKGPGLFAATAFTPSSTR